MSIDNLERVKFNFLMKMYTNCNQSVNIFLFVWYNVVEVKSYDKICVF